MQCKSSPNNAAIMNLGLFLKKKTVDCSMLSMFSWPEAPFDVGLFKVKLYSDCLLCPEKYSHPGYIVIEKLAE